MSVPAFHLARRAKVSLSASAKVQGPGHQRNAGNSGCKDGGAGTSYALTTIWGNSSTMDSGECAIVQELMTGRDCESPENAPEVLHRMNGVLRVVRVLLFRCGI